MDYDDEDDRLFGDSQGCIIKGDSACDQKGPYPKAMQGSDDTEYCCDDVGADPDTFNLSKIDEIINGTSTQSKEEIENTVVNVATTAAKKILYNILPELIPDIQVGGSVLDEYLTRGKLTIIFSIISVFTVAVVVSYIVSNNPCGGKNLGKGKTGFGQFINSNWFFGTYQKIFYTLITNAAATQIFKEIVVLFREKLYELPGNISSILSNFKYKRIILIALASLFYAYNFGKRVTHGSTILNNITGNWLGIDDPSGHTFMLTLLALDPDLADLLTDLKGNTLIRRVAASAIGFGGLLAFLMTLVGGFHTCMESIVGIVMGVIIDMGWSVVWPALSRFLPGWLHRYKGGSRRKSKKLKRVKRKTNKRKNNKRKITKRKTNKRKKRTKFNHKYKKK